MIALDTETTGLDLWHGCRPFLTVTCDDRGEVNVWEWDVDPLTRQPQVPAADLREVQELVDHATGWTKFQAEVAERHALVLQNPKFDYQALKQLGIRNWPWAAVRDTLLAAHLLHSAMPHDLTALALHYLGHDIQKYESALHAAVNECRRWVRTNAPNWLIAKDDVPGLPSAKGGSLWKNDTWLPRAVVKRLWETTPDVDDKGQVTVRNEYRPPELGGTHPWWSVLNDYARADAEVTLLLWQHLRDQLHRRGLWSIYLERLKTLPIAADMEDRGVTVSGVSVNALEERYSAESAECATKCCSLAAGFMTGCVDKKCGPTCKTCSGAGRTPFTLTLPKSGVNNSLRELCFEHLKLPPVKGGKKAKTSAPTLDKAALLYYEETLKPGTKAYSFVKALRTKRKRDTNLSFLASYRRFWLPLKDAEGNSVPNWWVLHPNLNPTGTATLRWSSSNPNEQNISKQPELCVYCSGRGSTRSGPCTECGGKGEIPVNLRSCFGPAPGREWWSMDAKNIELRIPSYESGEKEFIDLFERADDPPYYGSNHLLVFHTIWEDIWNRELREVGLEKVGPHCKKKYAATNYQWTKNGNFAVLYGAVDRADGLGTADRAYHQPGAQAKIKARFRKMEELNQYWIRYADKHGYVETLPDRDVDPKRGYPIVCTRTEYGKIRPTVPLNYHVQGSACWWMVRAMNRCHAKLTEWRNSGFDGFITMQVHDELVFDFPKSTVPLSKQLADEKAGKLVRVAGANLWRIRILQGLMRQGGDDIGIPTPVSCEYHDTSWAEGVSV